MTRILLVEDDGSIRSTVTYYLQNEGFLIETAMNQEQALQKIEQEKFSLVLLDITLPDGNGYEFYGKMKRIQEIPVIFLTALDEEKDIVKGFDMGADDYITKPFHARELLSRIKNVLRHTSSISLEEKIKIKEVEMNFTTGKVLRKGKEVILTALEYKILGLLFKNRGRVIAREQILENIWDENENYVNDNTLTVYIKRIREKIEEDVNEPQIIKTVRGIGYEIEK